MIINIQVAEKRAKVTGAPVIVCGNADYSVQFTFDEEWSGHVSKTARFVYVQDGSVRFTDVLFEGDTAAVPVLANTKEVRVGVLAGSLKTTSSAVIPCEPSIRCGCGEPKDPTPSQYDQILDLLNGGGSNALKGKGEGAVLSFPDVSPVEHTLKVKLRSKNLFDASTESEKKWVVLGTGELRDYSIFNTSDYIAIPPNTTFTVNYMRHCCFYDANKVFVSDSGSTSSTTQRTFTMPANAHYVRFSYQPAVASGDIVQLELGTEVGPYTPFADVSSVTLTVNGKPYRPEADGTVEGVKSLYPTTALTTDAEGVIIEAEYNRDVNKAYQALVDAIVALGGSV